VQYTIKEEEGCFTKERTNKIRKNQFLTVALREWLRKERQNS